MFVMVDSVDALRAFSSDESVGQFFRFVMQRARPRGVAFLVFASSLAEEVAGACDRIINVG